MATNLKAISLSRHKGGDCSECTDRDEHDPEAGDDCDCLDCFGGCEWCDGSGLANWGWSPEEIDADCDTCDAKGVTVDLWGEDANEPVCRECALSLHAQFCGCDGWPAAGIEVREVGS